MKRRAKAERDRVAAAARSATVHWRAGSACRARSAAPTWGSPEARNQAGAWRVARREVLAQHLDERDVEQAVEQRLLAGLVAQHLAPEQVHRRAQRAAGAGRSRKVAGSESSVGRQRSPSKS